MSAHLADALSAFLDGELAAEEERAVSAHLVACPKCSFDLEALRQARDLLRALPPVEPPPGFPESLLVIVYRRRGVLAWAASVLAAAAVMFGLVSVPPPSGLDTPTVASPREDTQVTTASFAAAFARGEPLAPLFGAPRARSRPRPEARHPPSLLDKLRHTSQSLVNATG
jgi:anti-sigma factor RsiW